MKDKDWETIGLVCLGLLVLIILEPLLYFLAGALVGWILENILTFMANWIISVMALFHVELTLSQLPLFCGTLGFIGAYFIKSSTGKK
jgi:hypothetical protein